MTSQSLGHPRHSSSQPLVAMDSEGVRKGVQQYVYGEGTYFTALVY